MLVCGYRSGTGVLVAGHYYRQGNHGRGPAPPPRPVPVEIETMLKRLLSLALVLMPASAAAGNATWISSTL